MLMKKMHGLMNIIEKTENTQCTHTGSKTGALAVLTRDCWGVIIGYCNGPKHPSRSKNLLL